jgi:ribosomal protein L7/L12
MPMLTEEEWQVVSPHLSNAIAELKEYRQVHGFALAEAKERAFGYRALELYEQITGFKETNVNAL